MAQRYKFYVESKSFPLDISGEPHEAGWVHDWLSFKMQNDTKQKQTNVKSVSVSVHSMLIYVKNKGNDSIFFQKDLEGIEYMRTFANVIKRVTPQE